MRWSTGFFGFGAATLLAASVQAAEPALLLPATPMVLKDGRIARLAVYAIPVPPGQVTPDAGTAMAVDRLIDTVATDCFLTAQAIGHAEATAGGADPLASHRLARDRADHVRSRLLARGLPEASVASVWDWQQGLREARVTLWVFQTLKGEDCENAPLPGPRPPAQPSARLEARRLAMLAGPPDPPAAVEPAAAAGQPEPSPIGAANAGTPAPLRAPEPSRDEAAKRAAATASPPPPPAAAPQPSAAATASVDKVATATDPSETLPLSPQVVDGPDGLTITFDADSSYLPHAASRELRRLAARLESGRSYAVDLEGTVAPDAAGADPGPGQAPYGRWIAERRMSRIEEMVRRNSNAAEVSFRQGFVADDASRRVTIRLRALP